jgi:hypothetical protein
MYSSVHEALRLISGKLSTALVPETTYSRLLAFAARYPELGQAQYLECRLGSAEHAQVDLLVSAATTFERRALQAALAARHPDDRAGLPPLRRLLERWCARESALHDQVPLAWLEFDHIEREVDPTGNVCVCLVPAYLDPFAALPEQTASQMHVVALESILAISARPAAPAASELLQTCFAALPDGGRWIHLSVMLARDPVQLKLYGVFPRRALLPYLHDIGWAGNRALIEQQLDRTCPTQRTADSIYVDLPVDGMREPALASLGLAFGQQHLRTSGDCDPTRRALLDSLVGDALCTPAQRDALLAWPGREPRVGVADGRGVPDAIEVQRWLDIKLVCPPSASLQAKAYLGFAARRTPGVDLRRRVGSPPAKEVSPGPLLSPRTT